MRAGRIEVFEGTEIRSVEELISETISVLCAASVNQAYKDK